MKYELFSNIIRQKKNYREDSKLKEKLIDRLKAVRNEGESGYAFLDNKGNIEFGKNDEYKRIKTADESISFDKLSEELEEITRKYSKKCYFDRLVVNLKLGLIFNSNDLEEKGRNRETDQLIYHVKENRKPIQGIVYYYVNDIDCYLGNEKTNPSKYTDSFHMLPIDGYINYNLLMSAIQANGLSITEIGSFESFKRKIMNGEIFDITMVADFREKEEEQINDFSLPNPQSIPIKKLEYKYTRNSSKKN